MSHSWVRIHLIYSAVYSLTTDWLNKIPCGALTSQVATLKVNFNINSYLNVQSFYFCVACLMFTSPITVTRKIFQMFPVTRMWSEVLTPTLIENSGLLFSLCFFYCHYYLLNLKLKCLCGICVWHCKYFFQKNSFYFSCEIGSVEKFRGYVNILCHHEYISLLGKNASVLMAVSGLVWPVAAFVSNNIFK